MGNIFILGESLMFFACFVFKKSLGSFPPHFHIGISEYIPLNNNTYPYTLKGNECERRVV